MPRVLWDLNNNCFVDLTGNRDVLYLISGLEILGFLDSCNDNLMVSLSFCE
jgi:hypothetical protein